MKLLLDTHAWLWFSLGDPQLSAAARAGIEDPLNQVFVSPASFWELAIKISLGKYTLASPYQSFVDRATVGNGFQVLPISAAHTERLLGMPFHHRDPFDRLLVAQAGSEGLTLVSADGALPPYGVPILW